MGGTDPAVRVVGLSRVYRIGQAEVLAVDDLSLTVPSGQRVALVGRSGSGKSTLLNLLAGIDTASRGEIWIGDQELSGLRDDELTRLRRDHLGIVYQFYNLLPTLSVWENVALPALLAGARASDAMPRARALLGEVGLDHRAESRPHTLSGGEMQRTAIARALINEPRLLLADEPTGNLDSRSAAQVLELLEAVTRRHGTTMVIVTHSDEVAAIADRVVELRDGRVIRDELQPGSETE